MEYFLYVVGVVLAGMGIMGFEQASNSIHQAIALISVLSGVVAISGAAITQSVIKSNKLLQQLCDNTQEPTEVKNAKGD